MAKPLVAVVGRPNVGKSTLFNAIVNKRISIVEDIPGVTRDRIYFDAEWLNREFTMIDTGGIEFITDNSHVIPKMMRLQAELAIEEADVILFVVDGKQGIVPADEEVANILRASGKPVVLVVNKIDSVNQEPNIYEFYNLGLGDPIGISAKNLMNLGDLLDDTVKHFPPVGTNVDDEDTIHVAVIGRPNVGKSSLTNALLGQDRVIVSDVAGTTRDSIDTYWTHGDQKFVLIDTAGMRRKSKIEEAVERYSIVRSLRSVDRSDIVVLVLDAQDGVTEQDKKDFVKLFGEYLRVENILQNFDEFTMLKAFQTIDSGNPEAIEAFKNDYFVTDDDIAKMQKLQMLSDRIIQDYKSTYNDIRDWLRREKEGKKSEKSRIDWDDVIFEIDLLKSQEINLDYILELIFENNKKKMDKSSLIEEIRRVIRSSVGNRAKESLIVDFINDANLDVISDRTEIIKAFFEYAQTKQKKEASDLIESENLNEREAKHYIEVSLRREYASENGTDFNNILPKMSPLNPLYLTKKHKVFEKIAAFVEKFKGVGGHL